MSTTVHRAAARLPPGRGQAASPTIPMMTGSKIAEAYFAALASTVAAAAASSHRAYARLDAARTAHQAATASMKIAIAS